MNYGFMRSPNWIARARDSSRAGGEGGGEKVPYSYRGERGEGISAMIAAAVPLNRVPPGIDKLIDASRVAGNLAIE